MVASTMTFAALASTLILRHALAEDWISLKLPRILWANTALLILSSACLEWARHALRAGKRQRFNVLWWIGSMCGAGFLAGQVAAWLELRAQGIFVASNPSHGFFYILTWTHAAHAFVGLVALFWVGFAAIRYQLGPKKRTGVLLSATFWHFLDVMWLGLVALFFWWG